ncbi:MAG: 23S rRNA (pseudouridine(1915)-N(3))-methyltransferase RlmH [Saprospiraceae bacterium]|nr:23S rRNA (pseudouridine(1915)-N(3))-methyltransferase RlmH [Saprospiraceae bacterium]
MKIELWMVGKTTESYLNEGVDKYEKRLKHYTNFSIKIFQDVKSSQLNDENSIKKREAELIMKKLDPTDYVILLDEKGKELSSSDFAIKIEQLQLKNIKNIIFIIGGAFGFDEKLYQISQEKLSLSKMTFSHQMVRLFFVEQLYRAHTILKGESYHHQ